ncbi:HlyD family efflux transporter periplasmic adaptor subunit [Demequina capsici]|uniref:HlyD family efflux transporter periplasmic adaptor subunit n=1 Tax=Demequina capsici TaxID=3075620 RepID=A0AA96F8V4_9MICO|nr:HlyD family efflux transporter periplasmic adaptor subunit [Demequina sp. OYTSA14]WNM24161.1 HlyD family efflux transporter periplasmic adaptor subunit [Demequina sp. OYTSA14]
MTWGNRFKLLLSFTMVLGIVAAATLLFNQRELRVDSTTASIEAAAIDVGTDYGGLVTAAAVKEGDHVSVGDPLLTLESQLLARDIAQGIVDASTENASADGTYTILSTVDGTVTDMPVTVGSYAQPGDVVGHVDETGTLYIDAQFMLSPADFGRIEDGAQVDLMLPDRSTMAGTVTSLDVETTDGDALVTVRVDSPQLTSGAEDALVAPGTPIEATLHLRDDGPLAGVTDMLVAFAHRIGL